jgi:hypothetical protein
MNTCKIKEEISKLTIHNTIIEFHVGLNSAIENMIKNIPDDCELDYILDIIERKKEIVKLKHMEKYPNKHILNDDNKLAGKYVGLCCCSKIILELK